MWSLGSQGANSETGLEEVGVFFFARFIGHCPKRSERGSGSRTRQDVQSRPGDPLYGKQPSLSPRQVDRGGVLFAKVA